jgi:hypothetical protein
MNVPLAHVRLNAASVKLFASGAIDNMDRRQRLVDQPFFVKHRNEIQDILTTATLLCQASNSSAELFIDHGLVAQMLYWAAQTSDSTT